MNKENKKIRDKILKAYDKKTIILPESNYRVRMKETIIGYVDLTKVSCVSRPYFIKDAILIDIIIDGQKMIENRKCESIETIDEEARKFYLEVLESLEVVRKEMIRIGKTNER